MNRWLRKLLLSRSRGVNKRRPDYERNDMSDIELQQIRKQLREIDITLNKIAIALQQLNTIAIKQNDLIEEGKKDETTI